MPSKSETSQETYNDFLENLKKWDYWKVISNKQQADLIIKMASEASKGITATSWGGTTTATSARKLAKVFRKKFD